MRCVGLRETRLNHVDGDFVGDQLPSVNELLRGKAERRASGNFSTEEVASCNMGCARCCGECLRLRPLPCAWGAEKDEDHLIKPS